MATSPPIQVPAHSYDDSAVSVVVANRNSADPRPGAFFDSDFAAASPVYFHVLGGGKVFGVFSERWYSAATDSSDPILFSDYAVDANPSWAIFDGANGHHLSVPGQYGINPPTGISPDRKLMGACSRTNSYLYLLQSATVSGETFGIVSHYHINPVTWQVNLLGEDKLSNVSVGEETVIFDLGVKYNSIYLTFIGRDSQNRLYLARKNWGHIGQVPKVEYQSDKGWSEDHSKLVPLRTPTGTLTSAGPVSFADYRGRSYMAVVLDDAGEMSAQVYSSGGLWDSWTPQKNPYYLGTQGTSYLGGTVYLQPALRANPPVVSSSAVTGIPLVYAKKKTSGDNAGIEIVWDLWPISNNSVPVISGEASLNVMTTETADSVVVS